MVISDKHQQILEEIYYVRKQMDDFKSTISKEQSMGYGLAIYDVDKIINILKQRFETLDKDLTLRTIEDVVYELKNITNFIDNYQKSPRKYLSKKIKDAVFDKFKNKCSVCSSKKNLEIDHIIPVSRGGTDDFNNLQLLCSRCNLEKSNMILKNGTNN
jgi:5-methylcytosine-specific restriction endonuclease McrA